MVAGMHHGSAETRLSSFLPEGRLPRQKPGILVILVDGEQMADALGTLIDAGYRLAAYCMAQDCGHDMWLDLAALSENLGPDLTMHGERLLCCPKCGSRKVVAWLHPSSTAQDSLLPKSD